MSSRANLAGTNERSQYIYYLTPGRDRLTECKVDILEKTGADRTHEVYFSKRSKCVINVRSLIYILI